MVSGAGGVSMTIQKGFAQKKYSGKETMINDVDQAESVLQEGDEETQLRP